MNKIKVKQLLDDGVNISELQIRSIEGALYTLCVEFDGQQFQVMDDKGNVSIHRSAEAAKRVCAGLNVEQTVIVHQSAYDEMIGMPAKDQAALEMKVKVANPARKSAKPH